MNRHHLDPSRLGRGSVQIVTQGASNADPEAIAFPSFPSATGSVADGVWIEP
jgi:hypothetical protein